MNHHLRIATAAAAALVVSAAAHGEILNGDFENGGTSWLISSVLPNAQWSITFPATDGNPNGHAEIRSSFGDSEGRAGIQQVFVSGTATDTIEIALDIRSRNIDANPNAGRVQIYLDNALVIERPGEFDAPWETVTLLAPGGLHSLSLYLDVDAGNNGYWAEFDNLSATVVTVNPPGACCIDGGCLVLDFESCASVLGDYQGNNSDCSMVSCPQRCPADANGDGDVNFADLLILLADWGPCP